MGVLRLKKVWIPAAILLLLIMMSMGSSSPSADKAAPKAKAANPATLMADVKASCDAVRPTMGDAAADTCWSRAQCIEKKVGVKEMAARSEKYQMARLACK